MFDWKAFALINKHLNERYGVKVNPWGNFRWLAEEAEKHMKAREASAIGSADLPL